MLLLGVKLAGAFFILFIIPLLVGNGIIHLLKGKMTLAKSYLFGWMGIWAFCQLISVPLVLFRCSFWSVVIIMTIAIVLMAGYGIYKKVYVTIIPEIHGKKEWIAYGVMLFAVLCILVVSVLFQHTDADDSRFVVFAVDIYRTNKMFLTDPSTGCSIVEWMADRNDLTSPWQVFIALYSKYVSIYPTIMMHTFLPVAILTGIACVYWLLSDVLFEKQIVYRSMFVIAVFFLNIYGYFSIYSSETFMMTRLWQGKAVVASLGIPTVFLIFFWIYKENKREYRFLLLLANMAMCLMSGMGVIIGAIMIGCISFVYGIRKRNWRLFLQLLLLVIPNMVYYVINYILKMG